MTIDDGALLDQQIEDDLVEDDGAAAQAILASGRAVHMRHDDTPPGHVIRVYPDGREELIRVDVEALAAILG